jgi:Flp pilus assembly protein TadD
MIIAAALGLSLNMQQPEPEAVSLLGAKLQAQPDEKGEVRAAEEKLAADPKNIDLLIALGRAQAGVWRYRDAIATYAKAITIAPSDARLYRHRGHRYISIRQFDKAVTDMQRAAELNERDFDIWYHFGLAYYLKGEFGKAEPPYRKCYDVAVESRNDDSIVAITDWLYMTLRRQKKDAEAVRLLERITPEMGVKENKSYFDRLLFYKGLKKEPELVNVEKATGEGADGNEEVGLHVELGDDPAIAVLSALLLDLRDTVEHQHRRERQLRVAGAEQFASRASQ